MVSSDIKCIPYKSDISICKICLIIQKKINKEYKKNITKIYKKYEGFTKFQSKDQKKYFAGQFSDRCNIIYNKLLKKIIKKNNIILDYGSSNGAMIEPLINEKKTFLIEACDIKNILSSKIKKNKKFIKFNFSKNFFSNKNSDNRYDLITLIHVFEHLTNPLASLKSLSNKLNKSGKIFIQIPNFIENPYDLTVYDHTAHYTKESIFNIAMYAGLKVEKLFTNIIDCEFSILLSKNNQRNNKKVIVNNRYAFNKVLKNYDKSINWLKKQIFSLKGPKELNILGTSISATWIYSNFKNKKIKFYEEDTTKKNKFHIKKKINILKDNDKKNIFIFFPFAPIKLLKILKRYKKNKNIKILCPDLKI